MNTHATSAQKVHRIALPIDNLSYGGGGSLMVERALAHTPGVISAYVNSVTEMAYICYDPTQCRPEQLAEVIERAGFGPQASKPLRKGARRRGDEMLDWN